MRIWQKFGNRRVSAKAKTIEKFLGKDFRSPFRATDISVIPKKKDFSVDIEHNYKPIYKSPPTKKLVETLKQEADKADMVWLVSMRTRERLSHGTCSKC